MNDHQHARAFIPSMQGRVSMIRSIWLIGAVGAAFGLMAASAEAAPAASAATGYKAMAGESSTVQNVHWRRHHYWGYPNYYYGYAYPYPRWRYYSAPRHYYGYAPDFRFYYGPRRHHHYWRHWW
jgi:hypothetical protein